MTHFKEKVTLIIRSIGERTEQLCRELILAQGVAPGNVVVVREAPFSAAMRKSFEIGIERGLPWTFCVDADVLLRPGAVEKMVRLAEEQEENVCEIQGYILDKFFGGPRHGGVHLYRTCLLDKVIAQIPGEGVDIRPEGYTLKAMAKQGFPWATVHYLVGLHDFEQFYKDIFRKCFVQAHKHQHYASLFLSIWQPGAQDDMDYRLALHGFAAGIVHSGKVRIDVQHELYKMQFKTLQIDEKEPLQIDTYTLDDIEKIIENWVEPACYRSQFPTKAGLIREKPKDNLPAKEKFAAQLKRLGPVKIVPYSISWLLQRAAWWLQIDYS